MDKALFDDISEKNILKKKRRTKTVGSDPENETADADAGASSGGNENSQPTPTPAATPQLSARQEELQPLCDTMIQGFRMITDSFKELRSDWKNDMGDRLDLLTEELRAQRVSREAEMSSSEEEEDEQEEQDEGEMDPDNVFKSISGQQATGEKVGKPINSSLASMVDKLLSFKLENSALKEKEDKYPRPENVRFATPAKVNKPVWECLDTKTKQLDFKFQHLHNHATKAALPIAVAMEKLYDSQGNPESLDIREIITTLADSLNFLGSVNIQTHSIRKECIRKDLPSQMQPMCNEEEEISPAFLFGDDLEDKIKKVSVFNRVKKSFHDSGRGKRGRSRGRGSVHYSKRGNSFKRPFKKNHLTKSNKGGPSKSSSKNGSSPRA